MIRRSEVRGHMDSMSSRVERVERELEYLENKIPNQSDIEMEEALLEQQIKAAELDQLRKKAKLAVGRGGCMCEFWRVLQSHSDNDITAAVLEEEQTA